MQSECLTMRNDVMSVDSVRLGNLKFAAGVINPKFDEQEANVISHKFGSSFTLVSACDR